MHPNIYLCFSIWLLLPSFKNSFAATKGPSATVEQRTAAAVTNNETNEKLDLSESTKRMDLNLLIPIPVPFLGGMLVSKLDFAQESKTYSGEQSEFYNSEENKVWRDRDMAAIGAVYLPHAKEGAPKFFAIASRYGKLDLSDKTKGMGEYFLGVNMDARDTPFNVKFDPTHNAGISAILRYRQFPNRGVWLPLLRYWMQTPSGFSLDLFLPARIIAGWKNEDRQWFYYGGVRGRSRIYSITTEEASYWSDGNVIEGFLGVRKKLVSILHASFEFGMQKESSDTFDEEGEKISSMQTDFAPWAKLGLETWIEPVAQ